MCGILAIIGRGKDEALVRQLSKRMSHRGPDESDLHVTEKGHILSHERLSIIDLKQVNNQYRVLIMPGWCIMAKYTIIRSLEILC